MTDSGDSDQNQKALTVCCRYEYSVLQGLRGPGWPRISRIALNSDCPGTPGNFQYIIAWGRIDPWSLEGVYQNIPAWGVESGLRWVAGWLGGRLGSPPCALLCCCPVLLCCCARLSVCCSAALHGFVNQIVNEAGHPNIRKIWQGPGPLPDIAGGPGTLGVISSPVMIIKDQWG